MYLFSMWLNFFPTGPPTYSIKQQQAEIASFRENAIRTVQALNACDGDESELDQEEACLRGLEKKMLKRPPPNFVRSLLRLQAHQRKTGKGDLTTSLQLFSIASSKWARKRAIQLAAEDEYDAYHIFMAGLKQYGNVQNDNDDEENDDDDDYHSDEEDDFAAFCDGEDFDYCTEGDFVTESDYVNNVYDLKHSKHDATEDETEYDDSYGDEFDLMMMDDNGDQLDQEANNLLVR